jgi:hypothetical protein
MPPGVGAPIIERFSRLLSLLSQMGRGATGTTVAWAVTARLLALVDFFLVRLELPSVAIVALAFRNVLGLLVRIASAVGSHELSRIESIGLAGSEQPNCAAPWRHLPSSARRRHRRHVECTDTPHQEVS